MYMVLFVLHDIACCDEILNAWEEAGAQGITILPSTGMVRLRKSALREDRPLFPSLEALLQHEENLNRTFFTIVEDEALIDQLLDATQSVVGDLERANTGIFTVLPLYRVHGVRGMNAAQKNED
jgi:nitrogen regulatory protein P-II 1